MVEEPVTIGVFISSVLGVVLFLLRRLSKIYVDIEQHELNKDIKEDNLSLDAKAFLYESTKEHFNTIKDLASNSQEELVKVRTLYQETLVEKGTFEAKSGILEKEVEILKTSVKKLEEQISDKEKKNTQLTDTIDKLKTEVNDLQKEVATLKERAKNLDELLSNNKETIKQLREDLKTANEKKDVIEERYYRVETRMLEYRKQLKSYTNEKDTGRLNEKVRKQISNEYIEKVKRGEVEDVFGIMKEEEGDEFNDDD